MRRAITAAAIFYVAAEFFFTPGVGLVQTHAQGGPAAPVAGNAYEWQNGRITPDAMILVDPLALQQRATVNSTGTLNTRSEIFSTPAGPGAVTLTSTSTAVIAAGPKKFIAIDNESGSTSIACSFGGTAALNTAGSFTIPPGSTRVWNSVWIPSDAVQCISGAASSAATIQVQ